MTQHAAVVESQGDDFEGDQMCINPCDLGFLFHGVRMGTFVLYCFVFNHHLSTEETMSIITDFNMENGTLCFETPPEGMLC